MHTYDESQGDLVRQNSSRSSLLILARCWSRLSFLEVVTLKVSRVELTPEAVRACRYYMYSFMCGCSLSWRHLAFCLSLYFSTSICDSALPWVRAFSVLCAYAGACSGAGAGASPVEVHMQVCTCDFRRVNSFSFLYYEWFFLLHFLSPYRFLRVTSLGLLRLG